MSTRFLSVVLPVYQEHDNIGPCLRGLWKALHASEHEILVCYDFEEDSTLAAIRAMPDAPPSVRLVKNHFGRGAANAIRSGFAEAKGDVLVTTMADLSDPPDKVLELAAHMSRSGAAVVSGSRYMRGGSQSGGPAIKSTLSRLAGLTLHWIAGVGTHDPTTNFRAYSRSFLERITVESRHAFDLALEITVKAHLAGELVSETPSSWIDRTAGESRFRVWAWVPKYLRWYWMAMRAPALVWSVWLALALCGALLFDASPALLATTAALGAAAILLCRARRGRNVVSDAVLPLLSSAPLHAWAAEREALSISVAAAAALGVAWWVFVVPARTRPRPQLDREPEHGPAQP